MIIGIIAAITILFFGGVQDYFIVAELEKGIKEYVIEKDRQQEILADLSLGTGKIKNVRKSRKASINELKTVNASRLSTREDFLEIHDELLTYITNEQSILITYRQMAIRKITDEEWKQIIALSVKDVQIEKDKLQSSIDKGKIKDPFAEMESAIIKNISDPVKQGKAWDALSRFKESFNEFSKKLAEKNVIDNPLLTDKYASTEDLLELAEFINVQRTNTYESMTEFHFELLELTEEKEWNSIIKVFNKIYDFQ